MPASALIEPGVLTISTNASQPPMQYVDNGKVVGMRIELGEKIAAELGLKPNVINIDFASQIPGLTAGRWDMIDTGMYYSAQRAEQITMVPTRSRPSRSRLPSGTRGRSIPRRPLR